jgi:hypothetical protein
LGSGKKSGKGTAKGNAKRDAKADGKGAAKGVMKAHAKGIAKADGKPARADAGLGWDELEARNRDAEARLAALQQQLDDVLAALGDSATRLRAVVAVVDDLPRSEPATEAALELRRRLEQMLVAQQRTNELLDLALGVALEAGETPQQLRWRPARS